MKIIDKNNILIILPLACLLLVACERTELCYDHYPRAAMSFDWEREWERDYGMAHKANWNADYHGFGYDDLCPTTPEWVNLVKFRNNAAEGEHYLTPDGGDVHLEKMEGYSFLLYNGDTEYIILSDVATLDKARATATPCSRATISYVMEKHPGARSSNPPDLLYSAFIENVPEIKVHEFKDITVTMKPLVYTYLIRYEFEYGMEHVALARGALGGMAESVYLRTGSTSSETGIILFDCETKSFGCMAQVRSFGAPGLTDSYYGRSDDEVDDAPFTLNLEVMLTNGTTLSFNYDVAEQIRKQPRGGVITVTGIRIENEQNAPSEGGGFDVDLSGWSHVDVDFPDFSV